MLSLKVWYKYNTLMKIGKSCEAFSGFHQCAIFVIQAVRKITGADRKTAKNCFLRVHRERFTERARDSLELKGIVPSGKVVDTEVHHFWDSEFETLSLEEKWAYYKRHYETETCEPQL